MITPPNEMILHGVEQDLHHGDEEAEEEPDVDVLDAGWSWEIIGQSC